jgi:hypothetical protein
MARVSISDEQWEVARLQWESDPMVTFADIAEELGTSRQAVQLRSKRKSWQRRLDLAAVAEKAHAAADSKFTHLAVESPEQAASVYSGSPEITTRAPIQRTLPEVPRDMPADKAAVVMEQAAVDKRTEVLTQHRTELKAVRGVLYTAMKNADIDAAKRAKILAEGMKVLQDGERKAWGLETDAPKPGAAGAAVTVNVNRRAGVKVAR